MAFKKIDAEIPMRSAAMLNKEPVPVPTAMPPIDESDQPTFIPYDQVVPGLYEGEAIVELDTGEKVAVSVARVRKVTGGGMDFRAWARLIEDDGRTTLDPAGQEMELEFPFTATAATLHAFTTKDVRGEDVIGRELMLLVLGEPPTMRPIHVDPDAEQPEIAIDDADFKRHPEKAPPGTVLNAAASEAPIMDWSDEVRLNASIRHAITLSAATTDQVDVSRLLAL